MKIKCIVSFILLSAGLTGFAVNSDLALPVKSPLESSCILLGFEAPRAGENVENLTHITGMVVRHDADNMFISKGALCLRKKGHHRHKALLRWKLPATFRPGKYTLYSQFTLGGVSKQTFTIKAGPDAEHLSPRSVFSQKNAESWKMAWQKTSAAIALLADDQIIEIEVDGGASLQKVIKAFLLEFKSPIGIPEEAASAVVSGVPSRWLVTLSGGMCGLSLWGVDTEAAMRPSIGDPSLSKAFDSTQASTWRPVDTDARKQVVVDASTGNYTWSRGTGLAHIYLFSPSRQEAWLHLAQTGFQSSGWVNGSPMVFQADRTVQSPLETGEAEEVASHNEQGTALNVRTRLAQKPIVAELVLKKGWNRVLLKLNMQHKKGDTFAFFARLTDKKNVPLANLKTCVNDPAANNLLKTYARTLLRFVRTDDPSNLLHPGMPLKIQYDLLPPSEKNMTIERLPVPPFTAELELTLTDYDGQLVARKRVAGTFPGTIDVDFGEKAQSGYYAVHATLYDTSGKVIYVYPTDGFSVVKGVAAQLKRRYQKKMAVTYYFMSGGRSSYKEAFPWMQKMGIFRNIGSNPEFPLELAERAKGKNLILTMDFWDIHNAYSQEKRLKLVEKSAPFTRFFKSYNEIDIHKDVRMTPAKWTARTKGEYEAVRAKGPANSAYVGGSLVRPGSGTWFLDCLKLGIDQYLDAWDVHAYPQRAPKLEGTCSNSIDETELGVLKCYRKLGKTNTLPFWLGETGARACHGLDARRWQADTVAKMAACIGSRSDFHYIGFLWPWRCIPYNKPNDISTSHNPADAALYIASALIDGFDYCRLELGETVQAARFGKTIMAWSTAGEGGENVSIPLAAGGKWVMVDVVGRVRQMDVKNNRLEVVLTSTPVYLLREETYNELTSF
jgi:hypothetical protein